MFDNFSSFPLLVKKKHHFRKWLSQKSQWRHKKNKVKGSRFPAWKKLVSYHFFLFLCFLWPSVCFASQKLENRNTFKKKEICLPLLLGNSKNISILSRVTTKCSLFVFKFCPSKTAEKKLCCWTKKNYELNNRVGWKSKKRHFNVPWRKQLKKLLLVVTLKKNGKKCVTVQTNFVVFIV